MKYERQLNNLNKIIRRFFEPETVKTIFEIGSRDGVEAVAFNHFYPNATIHSFECNPATVPLWRKNTQNINNIICVEKAVSDKDGVVSFFPIDPEKKVITTWKDYNPGASSLFKVSGKYEIEKNSQKEITVPTVKLSTYFTENMISDVEIMWMDIQGAELIALTGLEDQIEKLNIINMEVEFVELYEKQPLFRDVKKFLNSKNFVLGYFTAFDYYSGDAVFINKKLLVNRPILSLYLRIKNSVAYLIRYPVSRCQLFMRKVINKSLRILNISYKKLRHFIVGVFPSQGYKKYKANTLWLFLQKIVTAGIAFFVGVYVARYLGPKNYGLMSYSISFVGLFMPIAIFGIDDVLRRELISHNDRRDELLSTSFWMKLAGSLLAIILVSVISSIFYRDYLTQLLIILFSFTFLFQTLNVFDIFFQSQVKAKRGVKIQIYVTIISALLKVLFIILQKNVVWFVGIYVIESMLVAVGLWVTFRVYYSSINIWVFKKACAKEILRASLPLMFSSMAVMTYMNIDQIMIGHMINTTSVGIYSIAVKMSAVWYMIPVVVTISFFPAIMNARLTDLNQYHERLKKLYFLMFWSAFAIALPISLFAQPIIYVLLGQAYAQAATVLQVYVWAGIAVFVGCVLAYYLIAENHVKIYFFTTLIGAVSNIILNFIFITYFGIIGSAFATLISYLLVVISIVLFKETRGHARLIFQSVILRQ